MEYIFNTVMDAFGIFFAVIGVIGLGAGALTAGVWLVKQVDEIKFNRQMAAETIAQNKLSTNVGQVKLQEQQLNLSLVKIDPAQPVLPRLQLQNGEYSREMLLLAAKYLETLQPVANVPTTITYSPHIVNRADSKQIAQDEQSLLPATTIMDFAQLFNSKLLPTDKFLLGANLEDGQFVSAGWKEFYSTLVIGQSGSGKSTLVRNILAQAALQGSRFMVIDPHHGAGDESLGESLKPLRHLMITDVAHSDEQMIATLKNVRDIGKRRLAGQDTDKSLVVLIVDETTALLSRSNVSELLVDVLGFISQETRKVAVYAICLGQIFNAEVFPSTVRNAFVNFISCRTRKDNARCATGSNHFATIAENLTIGQCVRMTPAGEVQTLAVPNCTQQHLEMVAGADGVFRPLLEGPSAPSYTGETPSYESENEAIRRTHEGLAKDSRRTLSAQESRIIDLFCSGNSLYKIVKDVYCVDGGEKYQKALADVQDVIRNYMNDLGGK